MLLQGQEIHVNPLDNDQLHLLDHNKRIQDAKEDADRDEDAFRGMVLHTLEHVQQAQQKKLMQSMVAATVDALKRNTATGQGLVQQQGPVGLNDVHAMLGDVLMGNQQPTLGQQPEEGLPKAA